MFIGLLHRFIRGSPSGQCIHACLDFALYTITISVTSLITRLLRSLYSPLPCTCGVGVACIESPGNSVENVYMLGSFRS